MPSIEITLGTTPHESGNAPLRASGASDERFDLVVDGERVSAASAPEHAACLLRDLVTSAACVLEGRAPKALVPLFDAPWELCLLGRGDALALSMYRTGPAPEVRLLDRMVPATELASQARAAFAPLAPRLAPAFSAEISALLDRLDQAANAPAPSEPAEPDAPVRLRSGGDDTPVSLALEALVPVSHAAPGASIRADLHALLFRGRVSLEVRGQRAELAPGFVFLQLERLVSLCRPILEAYAARRAAHLRVSAGGAMLGLRLSTDGLLALSVTRPGAPTFTAPALDPCDFARPLVDAALALARAAVDADRARARNLRLRALRSEARALRRTLRELSDARGKLNDDPSRYRAAGASANASASVRANNRHGLDLGSAARLRYGVRWRAEIEGIDLAGTLLCGDRLVVPGVRETLALDRKTGASLWSKPLPRAAMTLAGGDLLRLTSRGEVELRDVRDGEVLWSTRTAPRVGAPGMAYTLNGPGLPPLVILAEGERHLVALDLRTGEPRWRHAARGGGPFRIRRVGRLVVVVSGDRTVSALDAASGELVWRHVDRAPFTTTPVVHRDTVVAASGGAGRGPLCLHALDAYTGALRWSASHPGTALTAPVGAADVAAALVQGAEGVRLVGFDLGDGAERFELPVSAAPVASAAALNAFDELLVANLPNGRVAAVDAAQGAVRWSRVLTAPVADDVPRRLDVQLRAGALFVPQSALAVLRPRDGAAVADADACDLVPDLLRVDEECSLYVAEESGHVLCCELGARLSVVRSNLN